MSATASVVGNINGERAPESTKKQKERKRESESERERETLSSKAAPLRA